MLQGARYLTPSHIRKVVASDFARTLLGSISLTRLLRPWVHGAPVGIGGKVSGVERRLWVESGGSGRGPRYRSFGMGCAPCIVLDRRRLCRRHVGTFHKSSCEAHRARGVLAAVTPSPQIASLPSSEPVVNLKLVRMTPVLGANGTNLRAVARLTKDQSVSWQCQSQGRTPSLEKIWWRLAETRRLPSGRR